MNKVRSVAVSIIIIVAVSTLTLATLQLRRPTLSSDPQQASMFSDNFTRDTGLNTNLWQENGLVGRAVTSLWHAQDGGYSVTTIVPSLIFSSTDGMGVSGVTGVFQISTIDSISSFSPPFTLQATVTATEANGNPFALWIASSNGVQGLGVTGNLNPNNGNYYGMWKAYPRNGGWNALGTVLYRSPSINTLYQVTINVAADGTGSVEVSSNGATLGSSSQQVGRGPFYILLAQMEGLPYT